MTDHKAIPVHPVQRHPHPNDQGVCPQAVTLAAYEVYSAVHGQQPALIEGNCRGGFGAGELIALLYAKSFPKSEWRTRVDEALEGMRYL